MAWANVAGTLKANSNAATSPWNAGNLSAALNSGDRLVATVEYNSATGTPTISNVTDSLSNTWVKEVNSGSIALGGAQVYMSIWSAKSAAGTPSSITVTFSGGTGGFGLGISVAAYSGTATTTDGTELDISKIASGNGTTYDSGTTVTTTGAANELKIGGGGDLGDNVAVSAGTLDGTYTARTNDSPNANAETAVEDRDSGTTGSTARATLTTGLSHNFVMGVAVFKLAGAAVSSTRQRTLTGAGH